MTTWIIIALVAYFIAAANSLVDKYILARPIAHPAVYTFYAGIFSLGMFVLAPFGLSWPGWSAFLLALFVGIIFLAALFAFFAALRIDDSSRIVPIVGAVTPIFIFFFSHAFFGQPFIFQELYALILLIIGTIVLSMRDTPDLLHVEYPFRSLRSIELAVLSAFCFALFFVFAKFVFSSQEFVSGFVWTRLGSALGAFLLLLSPHVRELVFHATKNAGARLGALFVGNKILGGIGFILLNYAIAISHSPALVNALEGSKYIFLILFVSIFSIYFPGMLPEEIRFGRLFQKTVGITLVSFGIFIIALGY